MSGDISISIDVDGEKLVGKALRQGLQEGLEDAGNYLLDEGEDKARDKVIGAGRVWRSELVNGFSTSENQFNRYYHWKGKIKNDAPHSKIVEKGLAPAGEITGSNPSVQDIIPWVDDKLQPRDYDGPSPGATGGDEQEDRGITSDNFTVSNYRNVSEMGLSEIDFTSNNPRMAELSDGTDVVWKARDSDFDEINGAIRNEIVWSRAQEDLGWDLGPKSRSDTKEIDGTEVDATIQEFVHDSTAFTEGVYLGRDDHPNKQARDEFLAENRDFASKTSALDYLLGNNDRHRANIVLDSNGEPRTIDNGGARFDPGLKNTSLMLLQEQWDYNDARNPVALHRENNEVLDMVEDRLDEIADDLEFRKQLLDRAREVHGEDSDQYNRLEKVIGEDVSQGHMLYEDDSGVPLYKRHIQETRDAFQKRFDADSDDSSDEEDIDTETEDFAKEIDDALDEILGGGYEVDD